MSTEGTDFGREKCMNYLSIKYFLAVANEMNITQAAKKIYISQQSLSEHIVKLEKEYGVSLFERAPRLKLTYAGEKLKELAERAVDLDTEIDFILSEISTQHKVYLSIGMSPVHGRIILPCILPRFCAENPNVSLKLTLENSNKIIEQLANRKLDMIICFKPPVPSSNIVTMPIIKDRFCLLISKKLLDRMGITYEEATRDEETWVATLKQLPYIMSTPGTRVNMAATGFLHKKGIKPNVLIEVIDLEAQFSFCKEGMGAMFSFEIFARHKISELVEKDVLFIPIEASDVSSELMVAYRKERFKGASGKAFIECAKQFFADEQKTDNRI